MGLGGIGGGQPHVNASQIGGVSQTKGAGASEKSGFMSKIKNFFSPKAKVAAKQLNAPEYKFLNVIFTKGPNCQDSNGDNINELIEKYNGLNKEIDPLFAGMQDPKWSQEKNLRGNLINEAMKMGYNYKIN